MGRSTLWRLTAVCLVSSSVPSSMALAMAVNAAQALGLLTRDSGTCPLNFNACGQGLPSNFCCAPNSTCLTFNGGASAICCPNGNDCATILPIPCAIQQLNATAFPSNPMHTTDLTGTLETCGTLCCPQGYTCNSNNQCAIKQSSSTSTISQTSTSSLSSTATATSVSSSAVSVTSNAATSQAAVATTQCAAFPPTAVIAGFFPGIIFGVVATILTIMCLGHRRDKRKSSDFGHINATVSDPIYQDAGGATRTDFLRRGSRKDTTNGSAPRMSRARSFFSRSSSVSKPSQGKVTGSGMEMEAMPKTPENRTGGIHREPSMESITIYSPPEARTQMGSQPGSRGTTFTEMMSSVGLRKEEPYPAYLGSPGRVDPRSRGLGNGDLR